MKRNQVVSDSRKYGFVQAEGSSERGLDFKTVNAWHRTQTKNTA